MTPISPRTVIVIAGPTAVGKTAVAIHVANHFSTEIISADSRQCFKELVIGVARPSAGELQLVPHHFIASHSILEEVTAATFEQYALQAASEIFTHRNVVVMTGGTGLYIKAFTEGLDAIPAVPDQIRASIIEKYQTGGISWLQNELEKNDPQFFKKGEMKNPRRMMRALEVKLATGQSILAYRKGEKKQRDFNVIKIGLELPKDELNQRINARVDQMIAAGLVDEVKNLLAFKKHNALQTVGYAEIIEFLEGRYDLSDAIEQIKIHTRQYAKRQMTWFKKDEQFTWFSPMDVDAILHYLDSKMIP